MKVRKAQDKIPPQVPSRLSTGFPSPAEDYEEPPLDLHDLAVANPLATYFFTSDTSAMSTAGISPGDTLVVDRSVSPKNGSIVIAVVDDTFVVKRLLLGEEVVLQDDTNSRGYPNVEIWGTVTYVLKKV